MSVLPDRCNEFFHLIWGLPPSQDAKRDVIAIFERRNSIASSLLDLGFPLLGLLGKTSTSLMKGSITSLFIWEPLTSWDIVIALPDWPNHLPPPDFRFPIPGCREGNASTLLGRWNKHLYSIKVSFSLCRTKGWFDRHS